jgi:hypothetical protein
MKADATAPLDIEVEPHQRGWLRRPELDPNEGLHVWERPDGTLYGHPHGHLGGPLKIRFHRALGWYAR